MYVECKKLDWLGLNRNFYEKKNSLEVKPSPTTIFYFNFNTSLLTRFNYNKFKSLNAPRLTWLNEQIGTIVNIISYYNNSNFFREKWKKNLGRKNVLNAYFLKNATDVGLIGLKFQIFYYKKFIKSYHLRKTVFMLGIYHFFYFNINISRLKKWIRKLNHLIRHGINCLAKLTLWENPYIDI